MSLPRFLDETRRGLDEVYGGDHGWSKIRTMAGVQADPGDEVEDLSRRLGWLAHIDEPSRLKAYRKAITARRSGAALDLSAIDRRRWSMLDFQLNHRGVLRAAEQAVDYVVGHPAIADEFLELGDVLSEQVALPEDIYPIEEWPLALHRHYDRREIVAAVGFVAPGQKGKLPQGGVLKLPEQRRELLFVTLDKSGNDFSPTTRYRDRAISRDQFDWETQGAASVSRPSGQRYISASDWTFHLFVRGVPGDAYSFLGPVTYLKHSGDRPIAITWQLEYPMPAILFDRYATLVSG